MLTELSTGISSVFLRMIGSEKKTAALRDAKQRELISNIENAKTEIKLALDNFNNVTEPKLIDFYIYKMLSEQTRFEHLLSEYREAFPTTDDLKPNYKNLCSDC
ncbi:MAG: DUF2508 family protein [Clostridia bacterium]|nr:DUF2508 family protein [Clostridia bacterium]